MKRHPVLQPLSEEHHLGLVQARRLRRGSTASPAAAAGTARAFLDFWDSALAPHFRAEEDILIPYCALRVSPDHPLIVQTLTDHVRLRSAVLALALQLQPGADAREPIARLGQLLHDHIRFEERRLFPAIEAALTEEDLRALAAAFAAAGIVKGRTCPLPPS